MRSEFSLARRCDFANLNAWAVDVQHVPAPAKAATSNPCPDADGVNKVDGQLECLECLVLPTEPGAAQQT
ncbi:MAG: hypothetical protein IPF65_12190 [Polaromonas sp.]|nr:hypothetical protein [Polaromonas sp.]